jgi:hypothetical protein
MVLVAGGDDGKRQAVDVGLDEIALESEGDQRQ